MNNDMIIQRILKHCMGAYDMVSGNVENLTKPLVAKLEQESKDTNEFVDKLVDSKIFSTQVTFVSTAEKWDCTKEPLMLFLISRTHWNYLFESFASYFSKAMIDEKIKDILFVYKEIDNQRKQQIKQWLLNE